MSRKRLKVSHECSQVVDFCYRSSVSQRVLSDIPDEILGEIFRYLTPESLVQISKLRIQRLTGATYFKTADFSLCNTISNENLQFFFIREKLNLDYIKEINLNNVFFALPSTLTTCIQKCKNITKLYVFNCGLDYSHVSNIFNSCKALEEFYWTLPDADEGYSRPQRLTVTSNSLKKLCLQIQFRARNSTNIMNFLDMCPAVQVVYINYTPFYDTTIPANLSSRYFWMKPIPDNRKSSANMIRLCSSDVCTQRIKMLMQDISLLDDDTRPELSEIEEKVPPNYLARRSSFLQLVVQKDFLDEFPLLADESIKSLVIIMDDNFRDILSHLPRIAKMGGKALRYLTVCKRENQPPPTTTKYAEALHVSSILCFITSHSYNLTVLSLSELHSPFIFPLPFDCPLKQLKGLNLCACCLGTTSQVPESDPQFTSHQNLLAQRDFEKFVLNCNKVDEFGLFGCKICPVGPTDEKLISISKWKDLKSLILVRVSTIRHCQFFIPIAKMCPKLKMVELVQLSKPRVCHYIPSIVHILKESKELIFLRINQSGFYPMDPLFWKAVELASNLQGLCLSTAVTTFVSNKPILEAIKNLPYFHLFHLMAKGTCDNLTVQVKRIMHGKGVKIPNISAPHDYDSFEVCPRTHITML